MEKPTKETQGNLRKAMDEKDPVLIRSIIVAAGNRSLLEAQRAFDFAIDGLDPYKILQTKDQDFNFIDDTGLWTKEYFFEHTQRMMRNFSREAFEHYLKVGAKVFPDRVKPESIKTLMGHTEIPESAKNDLPRGPSSGMGCATVVGTILLGVVVLFIASR